MYNIANKHNKKTRKLSSSSRNKHKSSSKSKNKRKHKYTIGNTRKYTKYHNTIHIGGMLEKGQGRMAFNAARRQSAQALPAPASVSQRVSVKQARQSQSQRQSNVTISDSEQVRTPASPRGIASPSRRSSIHTVTETDIPPVSQKITENTRLSPPRDNMAQEEKQRAEAEAAKKVEAQRLKAEDDAKKAQREATKKEEKERLLAQSKETYDNFIKKINEYDFETSAEPPYIRFSKFIQEIMDLQFSIKDDQIRKQAQTITDQILNAYSALVSFYCSNKFLKKHFEDYMGKLTTQNKIKNKIQIKDLKQPTVNIDSQVSSITDKLDRLAQAQLCDHPLSEHLVPDTPTDRSGFALRLPSFSLPSLRLPSLRSSNSTNTSTNQTLPPPTTTTELMDMQGNPQQEDEHPQGRQRSVTGKLASLFRSQKNTSPSTAPPNVYDSNNTLDYSAFGPDEGLG